MKSIKSCRVRFHCCWVRRRTTFASVHRITRRFFGGHNLNWGGGAGASHLVSGSVLSLTSVPLASLFKSLSPPPPQVIRRCSSVFFDAQCLQMAVGAVFIWLRPSFLGIILWMTLYQTTLVDSVTGTSLGLEQHE
jgi:hypothetical protein